jgi:uncharacterized protein (DUF433 family)
MITLTREEAQQVLDALEYNQANWQGKDKAIEILRARLSAPEPEPVILRRGDILRCIETNELCTVWATSTTGKTQVKWKANDFGQYTAEQIGDLFWVEPKPEPDIVQDAVVYGTGITKDGKRIDPASIYKRREWQGLTDDEIKDILDCGSSNLVNIKKAEQRLKEKNT